MIMLESNGPTDEKFIQALEEFWGFGLPSDYKKFLAEHNGGLPLERVFCFKGSQEGSCLDRFYGICKGFNDNLLLQHKYMGSRIPNNTLPIANDVYGNAILLSVKGPDRCKVYFWDHEMEADTDSGEVPDYSNLTLIADSFDEFINNLKREDEVDIT